MFKIYCVSLLFTLLFTSCVQNERLEIRLTPIMKNDTISNIPLHDAVRAKDINKVKEILSDGFLLNTQDKAGFTALHLAVRFDQYDIAEYLINKKECTMYSYIVIISFISTTFNQLLKK